MQEKYKQKFTNSLFLLDVKKKHRVIIKIYNNETIFTY